MSDRLLKMFSRCFLPIAIRKIVFSVMEIWQLKNYYILLHIITIYLCFGVNCNWVKFNFKYQLEKNPVSVFNWFDKMTVNRNIEKEHIECSRKTLLFVFPQVLAMHKCDSPIRFFVAQAEVERWVVAVAFAAVAWQLGSWALPCLRPAWGATAAASWSEVAPEVGASLAQAVCDRRPPSAAEKLKIKISSIKFSIKVKLHCNQMGGWLNLKT